MRRIDGRVIIFQAVYFSVNDWRGPRRWAKILFRAERSIRIKRLVGDIFRLFMCRTLFTLESFGVVELVAYDR